MAFFSSSSPPRLISMQTSSRIGSLPRYPLRSPSVSSFNESPKCIKRGGLRVERREAGGGPRLKFGGNEATNLLKALHFILPSLSLPLLLSPRNTTHPTHSDGRTDGRPLPKRISSDPDNFCHSLRCTAERRMTARPAGGRTRRTGSRLSTERARATTPVRVEHETQFIHGRSEPVL